MQFKSKSGEIEEWKFDFEDWGAILVCYIKNFHYPCWHLQKKIVGWSGVNPITQIVASITSKMA